MKVLNKTTGGALVAALLSIATSDLLAAAHDSEQVKPEYQTPSSLTHVATATPVVMVETSYRTESFASSFMREEMETYTPKALNLGAYTGSTARSAERLASSFMREEMETYTPKALNLGDYTGSTARSSDKSHIQSVLSSLYEDQEKADKFSSQFSLKVKEAYSLSTSKKLEEMLSATDVSEQYFVASKQALSPPTLTLKEISVDSLYTRTEIKPVLYDSQRQKERTCCGGCSIQ